MKNGFQGEGTMEISKAVSQSPLHVMIEFNSTLVRLAQLLPQFTNRETEVQRGQVICLSSHSLWLEPGAEPGEYGICQ